MIKSEAINEAEYDAKEYGGIWHVVRLDGEYYDVHETWLLQHKQVKSEYKTKNYYSFDIKKFVPKQKWYRKVIRRFNKFLLWLLKKQIDARADNRKA